MASAAVLQIEQTILKLPSTDQEFLYRRLERLLKPTTSRKVGSDFRKKRFAAETKCPRCGNSRVHRHGKYEGWQRYKCLSCNKTFNDATASPMAGTHHSLQKWLKYAECMSQGMSVRRTAQAVRISVPTAFYWRHKILTALRNLPRPTLTGIVEADETFFLESKKGFRRLTRYPRRRGGVATLRGITHHQVCVLVARDRQAATISEVTGVGRVKAAQIQTVLGGALQNCVLCTDAASGYGRFTKKNNIPLEVLNATSGVKKRGIYHLNNVNAYHSRLKRWLRPFNGVSTKYLPNYLVWFLRQDSMSTMPRPTVANRLLDHSHLPTVFTTTKNLL